MTEDQGEKEDSFEIDSAGEVTGYISLDQARVLAMQMATDEPGNYGQSFEGVRMAFEVVAQERTEDHYVITLSFRPEGDFAGVRGEEQFFFEHVGAIAHRQVLRLPRKRSRFPIIPAVMGIAFVGVIAAGAIFVLSGDSDPGPYVGPPLVVSSTNTPVPPTFTPTVPPAVSAAPPVVPSSAPETPVSTATPVPVTPPTQSPTSPVAAPPTVTATPAPTSFTPARPTATSVPPRAAPVPPTATPTVTPVPPTSTPVPPTATPVPLLAVTKTDDTFDGVCDGDCSLREAIARAAPGSTIEIPAGQYTISAQITIDKDLDLTGAGAENTIIQAHAFPGEATSRVFEITGGVVTISGVTIRHGKTSGFEVSGAGILNSGTLTLVESVVSDNSSGSRGGGIYSSGTLTLEGSTVTGNEAPQHTGGGIWGVVTLLQSTVSDNTAAHYGGIQGGGTFINSTISGNSVPRNTGGNLAIGGGFAATDNTTMTNVTITENYSVGNAGGMWVERYVTVRMVNTLLANNTAGTDRIGPDYVGAVISLGHNFVGHPGGCDIEAEPSDIMGTVDFALDPQLGPLQDNGGATPTHALLSGSLAIDNADDGFAPSTDQRGVARPRGAAGDIGAYEQ